MEWGTWSSTLILAVNVGQWVTTLYLLWRRR